MTTTLHPARAFIAEHGAKLLRYCGVSVVNVISGQAVLAFCLAVIDLRAVPSQVIAAMVSAIPAYILSRRWVWKQSGRDSFRTEVLPFWTIALVGLIFAVTSIAIVEQFTENTLALMFTSLAAYGVVWVAKYIILDKVMWRTGDDESSELAAG
ncbi:MAG: GtrA family protein [Actinomycetota bacterium]